MKKKKYFIVAIILFCIICGWIISIKLSSMKETNESDSLSEYILFNDGLHTQTDTLFIESELAVGAIQLEKQIGSTDAYLQVFSIKGLDSNEWVCLRIDGQERIYHNSSIKEISNISQLKINKVAIRNQEEVEIEDVINDNRSLQLLVQGMSDENIVQGEISADKIKKLTLYSEKYKGLCYVIYYIVDNNEEHYIYDANEETIWKLQKPIFTWN